MKIGEDGYVCIGKQCFVKGLTFAPITIVYRAVPSLLLHNELWGAIDTMVIGWGLPWFVQPTGLAHHTFLQAIQVVHWQRSDQCLCSHKF